MMNLDLMELRHRGQVRHFFFRKESSDLRVIEQMFDDRDYDLARLRRAPEIERFAAAAAVRGKRPLIIDAGANIGASSVYFAARYPDALIIAIEPAIDNYRLLVENTLGLPVRALACAVASSHTRFHLVDVGEGFWGYQTRPSKPGEQGGVEAVTVGDLYERHAQDCFPFIVKVDIEGGERDLFSNHVEWMERTPVIIVEVHDWLLPKEGVARPFLRAVSNLDRDFVHIGENIFSIANGLEGLL